MKLRTTAVSLIVAAMPTFVGGASAQTLRPTLDYASAATIRDTCITWASSRKQAVAIGVYDPRGTVVAFAHQNGVSTAAGEIARWKGESSAKFGRATADLAKLDPPPNMPAIATIRGGVPIYSDEGVLLGAVGTSGMRSEDDEACGKAGIEAAGLRSAKPAP